MALTNFPSAIQVTLGSKWNNTWGLNENDVIVLNKVAGQDKWTEDGTDTPDSSTNRFRFTPSDPSGPRVVIHGAYQNVTYVSSLSTSVTTTSWYKELQLDTPGTGNYTFLDIFSGTAAETWSQTVTHEFYSYVSDYDVHVFKAMAEYVPVITGICPISATTTTTAVADVIVTGSCAIVGTTTVTGVSTGGPTVITGICPISATTTATAVADVVVTGSCPIVGTTTVTADADVVVTGACAIVATTTSSGAADVIVTHYCSFNATTTCTMSAYIVVPGSVPIVGTTTVTGSATTVPTGEVLITGTSSVTATASVIVSGSVSIVGTSSASCTADVVVLGDLSVLSTSTVTATADVIVLGICSIVVETWSYQVQVIQSEIDVDVLISERLGITSAYLEPRMAAEASMVEGYHSPLTVVTGSVSIVCTTTATSDATVIVTGSCSIVCDTTVTGTASVNTPSAGTAITSLGLTGTPSLVYS